MMKENGARGLRERYENMNRHLLEDAKPSDYFTGLGEEVYSIYPFTMLGSLKQTPQSPVYHPEGSVWNHTMLVVDQAAARKSQIRSSRVLMWSALLHDIGKPGTTRSRNGKITSYEHEKYGSAMAGAFLKEFDEAPEFIGRVCALVRWHMQILHVVRSNRFADIQSMKEQTSVAEVALLGLCDRLGRAGSDQKAEEENIRIFLHKCGAVI